jgi:hypothetical protein
MITKERLDLLNHEAEAADDAYETALQSEHVTMRHRYQPTLLSARILALREARDTALLRRSNAMFAYEREP